MAEPDERMRVDAWIWAVRLVKTRSMAADAAKGGRVSVNGQKVKPSREIRPGDKVELTVGPVHFVVTVRGLAKRRVSASVAAELYEETAESRAERERVATEARIQRLAAPSYDDRSARPTKRDRRRFEAARREQREG